MAEDRKVKFSANTEPNPREHCNAIFTRSGKVVGDKEVGVEEEKDEGHEKKDDEEVKEDENDEEKNKREIVNSEKKKNAEKKSEKNEKEEEQRSEEVRRSPPIQRLPYPPNSTKIDQERQRRRFIDIFKHLKITVPFSEALEQIPSYGKYMKELLNKKGKLKELHEEEVIQLNGSCSAILQRLPPPKHRNSRSLILPITLDNNQSCNAMIDSGATINLMPLTMLQRLGDVEVEPVRMTLQLADKSVKLPEGVAENVSVKVEHLNFPVDFVVVDVPEDKEVPLILGMPFIETSRTAFDVDTGILKVRQGNEEVHFKFNGNHHRRAKGMVSFIEDVDDNLEKFVDKND